MNGARSKALRQIAERVTVGGDAATTKAVYKKLKKRWRRTSADLRGPR